MAVSGGVAAFRVRALAAGRPLARELVALLAARVDLRGAAGRAAGVFFEVRGRAEAFADLRAADLRAVDFRAVDLRAVDFRAVDFRADRAALFRLVFFRLRPAAARLAPAREVLRPVRRGPDVRRDPPAVFRLAITHPFAKVPAGYLDSSR